MKHILVFLLSTALLSGCSEGETLLESAAISGLITFNGKSNTTAKVTDIEVTSDGLHSVQGDCDKRISFLEISVNDQPYNSPLAFAIGAGDLDCSDGKFQIDVDNIATDLGLTPSVGDTATIKVRGRTATVFTTESTIKYVVTSANVALPSSSNVVAGSTYDSGTQLRIKTRIGLTFDGQTATGSSLKVVPK